MVKDLLCLKVNVEGTGTEESGTDVSTQRTERSDREDNLRLHFHW